MNKKLRDISVIIVDDEEDWLKLVAKGLVKEGAEVQMLKRGDSLFSLLERFDPCVIVINIMAPEKYGIQIFSELKNEKKYSDIPVILFRCANDYVCSTWNFNEDEKITGMDAYAWKDGDPIKNLINAIIGLT